MRRAIPPIGVVAVAGGVVGALIGLRSAGLISCDCAPNGSVEGCPCYPILGMWFSEPASYAWAGALIGLTLVLMQAIIVVAMTPRGAGALRLREMPFAWFGIELIEIVVVVSFLTAGVPDWSTAPSLASLIAVMVGLAVANYLIRRRFVPHQPMGQRPPL